MLDVDFTKKLGEFELRVKFSIKKEKENKKPKLSSFRSKEKKWSKKKE